MKLKDYVKKDGITTTLSRLCEIDSVRTHAETGEVVSSVTVKRDSGEDFEFESMMIDWVPVNQSEDDDNLDSITGRAIFKSVNNSRHPLLLKHLKELYEEQGEEVLHGKKATIHSTTVQLSRQYYMMTTTTNKDGKRVSKRAINPTTKEPVKLDFFTIHLFTEEKERLAIEIRRRLLQIETQGKDGGGFVKEVVKDSSINQQILEDEEDGLRDL